MTVNGIKEERKHRRISLEKNDGVYCIVVRALSAGKTVSLPAMDFSETGFRFAIVSHMINDFFEGEKLLLKAIAGSRNLTFKKPLELEIKWRKYDSSRTWVIIGCEIISISADAKAQFIKFIQAEEKFRGVGHQSRLNGRTPKLDAEASSKDVKKDPQKTSKDILIISGGAPESSSLETILIWVEEELRASGHHVERINLAAKVVKGCDSCNKSKDNITEMDCVQVDDAQIIIGKMVTNDVVIYASPVYSWGFSSQVKALIDRCHCLLKSDNGFSQHISYVKGQRQALIATTSDSFENNVEPLLTIYNRMLEHYQALSAGVLFICNCSTPDVLGEDIKAQSIKFAKDLFGHNRTPYPVLIPGEKHTGQVEGVKETISEKGER